MTDTKHYAERDIEALDEAGDYYFRHVRAMTGESLHGKSKIAAELAFRDAEIDRLKAELEALQSMQGEAVGVVRQAHMTEVNFFEDTDFGTKIPDGTKLYTQPQSPAGYVLVPVEPTDAMMDAGSGFAQVEFGGFMSDHAAIVGEIYSAMLSASQGGNNESK